MTDDPVTLHWSYNAKNMEEKLSLASARIEKLEAALLDLCDGWECCAVSRSMRAIASKALEEKK